jgi:DNA-binding transcriptional LysR family regulator
MAEPLALDKAVTLHQLRIFKAVADHLSFSAAAQDLSLSQPSVSYQIVLGCVQFLRTRRWK